jgi:class 3 adenylate cyclase
VRFAAEDPGAQPLDGERKTVTALFADIKGSMELMEDLDPEEARAIVDPALKLMMNAVHRYGGFIVQSTGDGIFALFGAPVAHEDHPQRALYAAIRLQEDLKRYSDRLRQLGKLPLQARVGVNTGEAVVRTIATGDAHTEYTPIGHSTGLAYRMQALAPIGSTAVTDATRKLCEGYFAFKSLGTTQVKGVSEPVAVHEVIGVGPLRTRLQVAAQRGLTKFVGRQAELEQMKRALELAHQGHGQLVAATGEPGVGKSRLFLEFKAIAQSGCLVLEAYSVSHGKASAYLPVIDLLKGYFEIAPEDEERKRREKVTGKVMILDRTFEDTLPYLYSVLGISESDDPLAQVDPQLRRRRALEAIKRILARESLNQPLIVIFEDLHWIDTETQALLNLIVDALATARILLLVNYRPEYHHQWGNKTYYSQLRLDPLGLETADEMLAELLGVGVELAPLKRLIIERTEGNPFFMEEMVQALFEQGALVRNGAVKLTKPLDQIRPPATVQAILASRIDRLPAGEKELLQTLAVLGREFSLGLIKQVVGKSDDELERMLSTLRIAEFIYEQPAVSDIEYQFKHALTQEVGYNSVLVERRRMLHERAGQATEELFGDRLEDHVVELARHYDRSGNLRKAVEYLGRAVVRSARQVAHSEAIGYFTRALELLKQLSEGVERDRQELNLQIALSWSMALARGPGNAEREAVLLRARELCEGLEDNMRLVEVLLGLTQSSLTRNDLRGAQELASKALELAQRIDAPAIYIASAHGYLGHVSFSLGELQEARQHIEHADATRPSSETIPSLGAHYLRLAGMSAPYLLAHLGNPKAALDKASEFLKRARESSNPALIAAALNLDTIVRIVLRDVPAAMERAGEVIALANEHGMPFWVSLGEHNRAWSLALSGKTEGIAEMHRFISSAQATIGSRTAYLALLADACVNNARPEEGLAAVAEGFAQVERGGERIYEGELYRLKGELLLMRDRNNEAEAEQCLRTAIDIAHRQTSLIFELRATTSLARLLKRQGKSEAARTMLAEIYDWFTEGFEFADLKDAKVLLEELSD